MKKIYTKSVFEFNKYMGCYELNQDESDFIFIPETTKITYCGGIGGGGSGGGGGTQTTIQKSDPWSGQQSYLTTAYEEAKKLLDNPAPQYYPNSTVVPFSPET